MKLLYCCIAIALFALACKKDKHKGNTEKVCGITDPVNNIPWLRHTVDSFLRIKQAGDVKVITHNGQDYVNVQANFLSCFACHLYTCEGKLLTYQQDSALLREIIGTGQYKASVVAEFGN